MIDRISVFESSCHDPYWNLAVEEYLLKQAEPGTCILYLWQNANTVVIGRNQNPWKECRTALLEEEGGHLARRLSGGGAVFHDLGNLNFTFLVAQEDYDLARQLDVICRAVGKFGLPAEVSGRNDIQVDGRKFSGNAFYKNGKQAYHHGTLLVNADMEKLGRYLNPSKEKLRSKGVDSVQSRVVNLQELAPEITVETLKESLWEAFAHVYGCSPRHLEQSNLDPACVETLTARNRSWEWNYGRPIPFTMELEDRFPWGSLQIGLSVTEGMIRSAQVYSDAMDWEFARELEMRLTGCRWTPLELKKRLPEESGAMADAARMLLSACE